MSERSVALIVGGGPGVSASCARLFASEGMAVAVAARNPDKPALTELRESYGVQTFACDAADPSAVAALFDAVRERLGPPRLVVHNIDGRVPDIFRQPITDAPADLALRTIQNGAFSAFLIGQQAALSMLAAEPDPATGVRGTLIFTNASAALKGFPRSAAFAMACHAKAGLAQSMARELGPSAIHVVNVPIDAAIGVRQDDGGRAHWAAGPTKNDNMADPDRIAEVYLQLHQQHRSTWTHEVVLRPWTETW